MAEDTLARLEQSTIQRIPRSERHGKASDLFTIWFGSNIMMLTIVTGALAVTVFKQPFWWGVLGIVIGTLIGAIFMALHSAQGPQLGVPQMVQTRGQFGSIGSLLVVALVVIMYLGFFASNLVLGGQALASLTPAVTVNNGVLLVGALSLVATIFGYNLIHAYTRLMTWLSGVVLVLTFAWIIFVHGLPADFFSKNSANLTGFLGTISVAALWQIAYAPYVSDYSRYMPEETGARTAFWSSYWGCSLGSIFPMILGAMVGLLVSDGDVVNGLTKVTHGIAPLVVIVLSVGIAATNAMNLYCGTLSTITIFQTLFPNWQAKARARAITAVILFSISLLIALFGQSNFLVEYTNFILLLLYVLVPWTAVNLIDYYLVCHGEYDVDSFFRADGGVYGRFNGTAIFAYVFGIAVQLPFVSTDMYTGPVAKMLNGADLSWIVGLVLTSLVYYVTSKFFGASTQIRRAKAV
ncbi:cytosine permease [Burkholderia sp. Ax-1719]|jgi:nucleobase:cation symporter-1, NCS1 family|uniref:purine-cytosine permease family protein n=1 Tax=Burkholderia sp. Ax-1719 TaxID=2608334 RepID=UPI00141DEC72|nr:cytosine permease [Burkholderia sp. Ax-1719]NIE65862.1 cytosine permease [Burkholderia sp. Ax-1719]